MEFGNGTDSSPQGNHTTLSGGVNHTEVGRVGKAFDFDGSDGFLTKTVTSFRSNDEIGTITAWVKRSSTGTADYVFTASDTAGTVDYVLFGVTAANRMIFASRRSVNNEINGATDLIAGRWYHIAITSGGETGSWRMYLDGIPENFTGGGGDNTGDWFDFPTDTNNINIGALTRTSTIGHFDGLIDEVIVFNKSLSPKEIKQLYDRQNGTISNRLRDITASPNSSAIDADNIKYVYNWWLICYFYIFNWLCYNYCFC